MANRVSKEMNRYNYLVSEIDAVYHEAALRLGLSDSALNILYAICDNGEGCLLQDISFYTGMSKQTMNSALRKLEKEEIIYLGSLNAKSKKVYLTEKGKRLAGMTAMRVLQIEDEIFASWKKEDVEKYLELTGKYLDCLKERIKEL